MHRAQPGRAAALGISAFPAPGTMLGSGVWIDPSRLIWPTATDGVTADVSGEVDIAFSLPDPTSTGAGIGAIFLAQWISHPADSATLFNAPFALSPARTIVIM